MLEAAIYALIDPLLPELYRYIGVSRNPAKRTLSHRQLWPSPTINLPVNIWWRLLRDSGRHVEFVEIDRVSADESTELYGSMLSRESFLIESLSRSHPLLNIGIRGRKPLRPYANINGYAKCFSHLADMKRPPYNYQLIVQAYEFERADPQSYHLMRIGDLYPYVINKQGRYVKFSPKRYERSRLRARQNEGQKAIA